MNAVVRLGLSTRAHPLLRIHPLSQAGGHAAKPNSCLRSREIRTSKDVAVFNVERLMREGFCVFTDGSARYRDGGVGGAARANTPFGTMIMKEYLGKSSDHRSIDGEILGALLGLRIIKTVARPSCVTRATMFIDSKQAIRRLLSDRSRDGLMVKRFDDELRSMKHMSVIDLAWVPAHRGVLMNELVDLDAKAAALGDSSTVLVGRGL